MLAGIKDIVNADPWLQRKGRWVNTVFMLESVDATDKLSWRVEIRRGRIESIERGPFVMVSSDLSFRAPAQAWADFWQPRPAPGCNDVLALLRRKLLRIEGNLQPFMANLFYFKGVLEAPRRLPR